MGVKDLLNLIALDSQNPPGRYSAIERHLSNQLRKRGARVQVMPAGVVGAWGEPELLLNAHMDTVRAAGWHTDPLKGRMESQKVYGLGACDTKGNIHCILEAVKKRPENLMVLFSRDEEHGETPGVKKFVSSKFASRIKRAVVLEPTENKVVTRHPGYCEFFIRFKAAGGHSSREGGENAIETACRIARSLPNVVGGRVRIGKIESNNPSLNVMPTVCTLGFSVRSHQGVAETLRSVKAVVPRNAFLSLGEASPPFLNKKPFISSQCKAPFWTEAAFMHAAGINTLVYGAGSSLQAHNPEEFVTVKSLEKCRAFLEETVENFS